MTKTGQHKFMCMHVFVCVCEHTHTAQIQTHIKSQKGDNSLLLKHLERWWHMTAMRKLKWSQENRVRPDTNKYMSTYSKFRWWLNSNVSHQCSIQSLCNIHTAGESQRAHASHLQILNCLKTEAIGFIKYNLNYYL